MESPKLIPCLFLLAGLFCLHFLRSVHAYVIPNSPTAEKVVLAHENPLRKTLQSLNAEYGAPIFVRIFKDPGVLETWVQTREGKFTLHKQYDICTFSGTLGPKRKQGDKQAPEGFYFVKPGQMNPWSRFHLSFNLGFPNAYDRYHGRTGDFLMVHGNCVSSGCYAMTDAYIEEIYSLAFAALQNGQAYFRVHIFPFPLKDERLSSMRQNRWYDFWLNLKEGYDYFEKHRRPPDIEVRNGRYSVEATP